MPYQQRPLPLQLPLAEAERAEVPGWESEAVPDHRKEQEPGAIPEGTRVQAAATGSKGSLPSNRRTRQIGRYNTSGLSLPRSKNLILTIKLLLLVWAILINLRQSTTTKALSSTKAGRLSWEEEEER